MDLIQRSAELSVRIDDVLGQIAVQKGRLDQLRDELDQLNREVAEVLGYWHHHNDEIRSAP